MSRPRKVIFLQDWGTYHNQTIVAAGLSFDEVIAWMRKRKKYRGMKAAIDTFIAARSVIEGSMAGSGLAFTDEKGRSLLWMQPYEDTWDYWECLLHETSHLLDHILVGHKQMGGESEARAYQHEYLFRSIRRKLQGTDPLTK